MSKRSTFGYNFFRPKISKDLISTSAKDPTLIKKKQKQIVEAACLSFFDKGFHQTSIREIASASGMSIGHLYHYISCKDDILFLAHRYMQETWYEYLVNVGIEETEEPLSKLKKTLYSTIKFVKKNRKLFQFVYSDTKYLDKKHLRVILKMDDTNIVGVFKKLLEEVSGKNTIKCDLDLAARLITFDMVFIALRWWNVKHRSGKQTIDFLVEFILRGLGITEE